jgi:hypothetical protein
VRFQVLTAATMKMQLSGMLFPCDCVGRDKFTLCKQKSKTCFDVRSESAVKSQSKICGQILSKVKLIVSS